MNLVGYACSHPHPPLRSAYLPLGGLTVLLGANDVGKSSLLRAITRDLSGGHFSDTDPEMQRTIGGVFYARVSHDERDRFIERAADQQRRHEKRERGYAGSRAPWQRNRFLRLTEGFEGTPSTAYLELLDRFTGACKPQPVRDAMLKSELLAFEPAGTDEGIPVWNVYWCLPPFEQLSSGIQEALTASDLEPFRTRRQKDERERDGRRVALRGVDVALFGSRRHLWVDGAPLIVCPLGQIRASDVPRGLNVPTDPPTLRATLARALNGLTEGMRHGIEDALRDGDPLTAEEVADREAPKSWLQEIEGGVTVHPDAAGAAAFLSASVNRLLPPFVLDRYLVRVSLNPLFEWVGDNGMPLSIDLRSRRADGLVEECPIEDAADGLQLWIQLALLQACEQADQATAALDHAAAEFADHARDQQGPADFDDSDDDLASHAEARFREMVEDIRGLSSDEGVWLRAELWETLERATSETGSTPAPPHTRLFVIDEPERHLHPGLQREAAQWLRETSAHIGAQCVVASHSASFLGLTANDEGPTYVHVARDLVDGVSSVSCRPFDAGDLRDLEDIRTAVGLDRGELLTTVSMFLIVEGAHDVVVLETVFPELRDARIVVLSLDGLSNYEAVLTSDALWRFTTAVVGLATDKFERTLLERAVQDPREARKLRKSDAEEETKILGKLLGVAERAGKQVHLLGHTGHDLIDVLDEDVVAEVFPDYPGHEKAQMLWNASLEKGNKAKNRKSFYAEHFGVSNDVASYERIARELLSQGRKPDALKVIVDQARSLALGRIPEGIVSSPAPERR